MRQQIIVEQIKPLITRQDGVTFEPDRIREDWLRCSRCLELVLATPAAVKRHQCRYAKERSGQIRRWPLD